MRERVAGQRGSDVTQRSPGMGVLQLACLLRRLTSRAGLGGGFTTNACASTLLAARGIRGTGCAWGWRACMEVPLQPWCPPRARQKLGWLRDVAVRLWRQHSGERGALPAPPPRPLPNVPWVVFLLLALPWGALN